MKKLAIVLAALLLACVFVGCGTVNEKAILGSWDVESVNGKTDLTTTGYRVTYVRYVFEEENVCKQYQNDNKDLIEDGVNPINEIWALDETGTILEIKVASSGNLDGEYSVEMGVNKMTWTQTLPAGSKGDIIVLKKVTE